MTKTIELNILNKLEMVVSDQELYTLALHNDKKGIEEISIDCGMDLPMLNQKLEHLKKIVNKEVSFRVEDERLVSEIDRILMEGLKNKLKDPEKKKDVNLDEFRLLLVTPEMNTYELSEFPKLLDGTSETLPYFNAMTESFTYDAAQTKA